MSLKDMSIGFALTGSFCTLSKVMPELARLKELGVSIVPIMSEMVWGNDTRFGSSRKFKDELEQISNREIIHDIISAEPIGPKNLLDALIIAPCTGNTISKIANGVTDSCVAMAAKATLRNKRPVIIAMSTNDGLGASARNIGTLLGRSNIFFVPFGQDDPHNKPDSLVADMSLIIPTLEKAMCGEKYQPQIF